MARVTAYEAHDMLDTDSGSNNGIVTYADEDLIIYEDDNYEYHYYGEYDYDDEQLNGVLERIEAYDFAGDLAVEYRGIELDSDFIRSAQSGLDLVEKALEDDDRIRGSREDDVLAGFAGDDTIRGGNGEDVLQGRRGADDLRGGRDDDRLRGGGGKDILDGGHGDDVLRGEESRDVFVFDGNDGSDVIRDFQDRKDDIWIEDGADSFRDLEIIEDEDNVRVAFAETEIILRDFDIEDLGRGDFVF